MTIFFALVALVHVCGLFVMLLALRRAPIAVEGSRGFEVITQLDEAHDVVVAPARSI